MNIDRKVLVLASFPAIMLGGCNFNEDFCIREGELVAWCDFSGIKEKPPVPQERHVIPFGTDVPYSEGTTFTQDTLRWSLPQGAYRFLFYTGNYELLDRNDYHETRLSVRTDTIDGEAHISEVQKFCCSSAFSERLEYRNPKRVRIQPAAFVQKLNIKINVSGNTVPLSGLNCTLSESLRPGIWPPVKGPEPQVRPPPSQRRPTMYGRRAFMCSDSVRRQRTFLP